MFFKLVCLALVATCCLYKISGAPANNVPANGENLVDRFAEFLLQDKELSAAIERGNWDSKQLVRNRRASEQDDMNLADLGDVEQEGDDQPGFFDRAAKFVLQLLQRFLKWINTD